MYPKFVVAMTKSSNEGVSFTCVESLDRAPGAETCGGSKYERVKTELLARRLQMETPEDIMRRVEAGRRERERTAGQVVHVTLDPPVEVHSFREQEMLMVEYGLRPIEYTSLCKEA